MAPAKKKKKAVELTGASPTLWRAQVMQQTGKNPVNKNLQKAANVAGLAGAGSSKAIGKAFVRSVTKPAKAGTPKEVIKEATKISTRRSASTKHPSGVYVNKETGAVYSKEMRTIKKATASNTLKAKGRAIKNSDVAKDIKGRTNKNFKKKFGK